MDVVVVGGAAWSPKVNFPTHHTARLLARDHRVLYLCRDTHVSLLGKTRGHVGGFHSWGELVERVLSPPIVRRVDDQLWVSPLARGAALFPLSYPPTVRALSVRLVIHQLRQALHDLHFDNPLLWFYWWFFPEIVDAVPHRAAVYDIYDDHNEYDYVRSDPRRQAYSASIENRLLRKVNVAFAVSQRLVETKACGAPVYYLPNGVDIRVAEQAMVSPIPADVAALPRPVLGYLGGYDSRFDWNLILGMAEQRPDWSFAFVGGGYNPPPRTLPNMHLFGNRDYPQALRYVHGFDVALIPFVRDRLTDAVCPAKLFDYLALGKPILATPIPAVTEIVGTGDEVYRGETAADFIRLAGHALTEDAALRERRQAVARSLTWEQRMRQAMAYVEDIPAARELTA